jgi:hypothetical protein
VKRLLTFRGFAHGPQDVLPAVHRLAFVVIELPFNLVFCCLRISQAGLELRVASLANCEFIQAFFHDSQTAFPHNRSLSQVEIHTLDREQPRLGYSEGLYGIGVGSLLVSLNAMQFS